MNGDKRKKRTAGLLVLVMVIAVAVGALVGKPLMGWISNPEGFRSWVEAKGWSSRLVFMGMVIFQVILAFIPGEPFEIAAGYAFGAVEGTLLSIAGAAVGSIITFSLVRRFGMGLVRVFFSEEKINSVKFLKTSNARNILFLVIYMIPGTPKDLLGYFAGLTDIPFPVFCLVCTLGRIPSVVTSTVGGDALGTKSYRAAILVFAFTFAISALGLMIYNAICKKHEGARHDK
ncbi:MAG: VTT domain-containing protein [Firmicutes bacterium]|nr:VTT domain-containing protein [Bacillota bacterium]MDY6161564.1 VTT domain-containing protein [Candidatus Faecousia sp.]